jgi:hypothetical protein
MLGRVGTRTAWFARAVCALSLALTALSVLLIALNLRLNTPAYFFWLDLTVLAIGYSVIGRNYKTRRRVGYDESEVRVFKVIGKGAG